MTNPTGPDQPLIFNWGDGSPETPAAYGEIVEHTYRSPGDWLITVREAVTGRSAETVFPVTANPDPPVLTVDDATVTACQLSPYSATLTNGFGDIRQVFSYVTFKADGMTAENTLYQRQSTMPGDDTEAPATTIPLTDLPDGSVRGIFGPFTIARDVDTVIGVAIRVAEAVAGPVAGHVDYVTSTVNDPDTGDEVLSILISDDFTLTVSPGDCSGMPTPGTCTIDTIVPTPEVTTETPNPDDPDGDPIVTTSPQQITTAQGVILTGAGLGAMTGILVIDDEQNGFPLLNVAATGDDNTTVGGTIGQLPTVSQTHFNTVLVQDQDNTTRCQITVDWNYTPGPIPEV